MKLLFLSLIYFVNGFTYSTYECFKKNVIQQFIAIPLLRVQFTTVENTKSSMENYWWLSSWNDKMLFSCYYETVSSLWGHLKYGHLLTANVIQKTIPKHYTKVYELCVCCQLTFQCVSMLQFFHFLKLWLIAFCFPQHEDVSVFNSNTVPYEMLLGRIKDHIMNQCGKFGN